MCDFDHKLFKSRLKNRNYIVKKGGNASFCILSIRKNDHSIFAEVSKFTTLTNKVAIITGSARGIGKSIALKLASEGAVIVLTDLLEEELNKTLKEIQKLSPESIAIKGDVTNRQDIQNLIDIVLDKWGKIDILVNNAGITKDKSFAKMTDQMWDLVLNVNLKGVFMFSQEAIQHMKNRAKNSPNMELSFGKIINISSNSADGNFGQANYAASKAGVVGFTKTLAIEYAKYRIQVNAIKPGFINTPMTRLMPESVLSAKLNTIPLKRLGEPEDIANAVFFLASPLSDFVTGTVLRVDGGERI